VSLLWSPLQASVELPVIPTPIRPTTNSYKKTLVVDDYQWLEDPTNPDVREWTRRQNARTRGYLDGLPARKAIAQKLTTLLTDQSADYWLVQEKNGRIFALRQKPPTQQPVLGQLSSLFSESSWHPIFDPSAYNTNGTTAIDWFAASPDGHWVAICLSERGSEAGTLHFFDVDTGIQLADEIPRVQFPTGGGSAAWVSDDSGILYTRYPAPGERPEADLRFYQQIWFHQLGTPLSEDRLEIGKDFPRIAEIKLASGETGQPILARVHSGDGGDFAHYLRNQSGRWTFLGTRYKDHLVSARFGPDGALYYASDNHARFGRIFRLAPSATNIAQASMVVPEGRQVIHDYAPGIEGVYAVYAGGGPCALRYFPSATSPPREVPILPVSAIDDLCVWHNNELVYSSENYLTPPAWYTFAPVADETRRTALAIRSPAGFDDIEVVREFARSRDRTKVPLNILRKKGLKLDGQNPVLLTGYGGYGISLTPAFDPTRRIWFDAGGVYVIANLRGGGEYGDFWHQAGSLTRKQNVFDDFIASAEHLIRRGYTCPSRLAIEGGSNGGLLMGAVLTQRPDLVRAVVSHVGLYDMLRFELDPNGQFNVPEFGSIRNPKEFKALFAYSPYHHVRDGVKYPAVLLTTGENDGRVSPSHSRKMAARLQASTGSGLPVLFRSSTSAGHGIDSSLSERIDLKADTLTFLFDQLGLKSAPQGFH
jgi:prolyl oligopeptidase